MVQLADGMIEGSRTASLAGLAPGQVDWKAGLSWNCPLESYMWPRQQGSQGTCTHGEAGSPPASVPGEVDKRCLAFSHVALEITHVTSDTVYSSLESHSPVQIQGRGLDTTPWWEDDKVML